MYDLPEHFPIQVDKDGNGPVNKEDTVAIVCWCGDPDCSKLNINFCGLCGVSKNLVQFVNNICQHRLACKARQNHRNWKAMKND